MIVQKILAGMASQLGPAACHRPSGIASAKPSAAADDQQPDGAPDALQREAGIVRQPVPAHEDDGADDDQQRDRDQHDAVRLQPAEDALARRRVEHEFAPSVLSATDGMPRRAQRSMRAMMTLENSVSIR